MPKLVFCALLSCMAACLVLLVTNSRLVSVNYRDKHMVTIVLSLSSLSAHCAFETFDICSVVTI